MKQNFRLEKTNKKNDNNIVTVAEARKILGVKATNMTDSQVQDVLNLLRRFCDAQIDATFSKGEEKNE